MNKEFLIRDDHIGIFKNFLPNELIDRYIKHFNNCQSQGSIYKRDVDSLYIEDRSVNTMTDMMMHEGTSLYLPYTNRPFLEIFFKEIYPLYMKKYSYLNRIAVHSILEVKIQETKIGEGYHTWHCENTEMVGRNRIMAFMVYLNDVQEGGETEFLYQKCRFKPQKNTLLLWPAQYTHVHRGNPPLSNDKYIITGWIEYGQ